MNTSSKQITRIFLADDEESVRAALKTFFSQYPEYQVIGEAGDGMDTVELCRQLQPDVLLLDIQMPLLDGINVAKILQSEENTACMIMLTSYNDRTFIQKAMDAGVFSYLLKPIKPERILPALEFSIRRSQEQRALKKEIQSLTRRLDERVIVERAKLVLMETQSMTEADAYQYIRELSRRKNISMAKIARYLTAGMEADL